MAAKSMTPAEDKKQDKQLIKQELTKQIGRKGMSKKGMKGGR